MDYKEFSSKIKSKYPQYQDMDDRELAEKMVAKYPNYSDVTFDDTPAAPDTVSRGTDTGEPKKQSFLGGIGKTFSDVYVEPIKKNINLGAVREDIDKAAEQSVERQNKGMNPLLANAAGISKSIAAPVNRVFGAAAEIAGNAAGKYANAVPGAKKLLGGMAGIASKAKPAVEAVKNFIPEEVKAVGDIIGSAAALIPPSLGSKAVGKAATGTLSKAGKAIEEGGKGFLESELKISKPSAKKAYGATLEAKKERLINDAVKYDLHKESNFTKAADKAAELKSERLKQADDILRDLSTGDNPVIVNPGDIVLEASENAIKEAAGLGEFEKARKIANEIIGDMDKAGLTKDLTVDKLVEAKKLLDKRGDLFKQGPAITGDEALNQAIRKNIYLSIVDKIGEISPELRAINKETKELIDIENVYREAQSRIKNRDKMSLTDKMAAIGGALGTVGLISGGKGELAAIPAAAAVAGMGLNKALSQGRGASALIRTGKALQSASDALNVNINPASKAVRGKLGSILGNQRGAVGAVENVALNEERAKNLDKWSHKRLEVYHGKPNKFEMVDNPDYINNIEEIKKIQQMEQKIYDEYHNKVKDIFKIPNYHMNPELAKIVEDAINKRELDRLNIPKIPPRFIEKNLGAGIENGIFNPKLSSDIGIHFGTPEQANIFATNGSIGKYYIKANNIVDVPDIFSRPGRYVEAVEALKDADALIPNKYSELKQKAIELENLYNRLEDSRDIVDHSKNKQFWKSMSRSIKKNIDALRYENEVEGSGYSYAVLNPKNIKSATGNSGAFSRTNQDIRGSSALPVLGATALGSAAALGGGLLLKSKLEHERRR